MQSILKNALGEKTVGMKPFILENHGDFFKFVFMHIGFQRWKDKWEILKYGK